MKLRTIRWTTPSSTIEEFGCVIVARGRKQKHSAWYRLLLHEMKEDESFDVGSVVLRCVLVALGSVSAIYISLLTVWNCGERCVGGFLSECVKAVEQCASWEERTYFSEGLRRG